MNKQELRTNKQELISKYELIKNSYNFKVVATDGIISDLKRLDEPQKVTIPQFVAEHIEWTKEEDFHLLGAMNRENFDKKLEDWFYTDDNMELFARAWLDGYEIEKEKRYLVKVKGVVCNSMVLKHNINEDTWYMSNKTNYTDLKSYHTKKELEDADFGWVFDCPGIEIEEVE
jgi:hypothetical protein